MEKKEEKLVVKVEIFRPQLRVDGKVCPNLIKKMRRNNQVLAFLISILF